MSSDVDISRLPSSKCVTCRSTFDSWRDQVRWFVDQVAARCIQLLLNFNIYLVHNPHPQRWPQKQAAAFRFARPKTELCEGVFPVFLLSLEHVRLFGSGGLLFQSPRTVEPALPVRNIFERHKETSNYLG